MNFYAAPGVPNAAHKAAPTLTEVVDAWGPASTALEVARLETFAVVTQPSALNEDQIVQRVMSEVQRQIDLMLEVRLREALMPVLARASDALVLEARNELASTLQHVVKLAVSKSLAQLAAEHGPQKTLPAAAQIPSTDPRYPDRDAN